MVSKWPEQHMAEVGAGNKKDMNKVKNSAVTKGHVV
jgi:hypothetical protein